MRAAGVSQWRACPRMLPGKQTWKHLVKTSTVTERCTRSLNWSSLSIRTKACAFVIFGARPGPLKSRALVREQRWHRDQLLMCVLPVSQLHATAVPPMAGLCSTVSEEAKPAAFPLPLLMSVTFYFGDVILKFTLFASLRDKPAMFSPCEKLKVSFPFLSFAYYFHFPKCSCSFKVSQ